MAEPAESDVLRAVARLRRDALVAPLADHLHVRLIDVRDSAWAGRPSRKGGALQASVLIVVPGGGARELPLFESDDVEQWIADAASALQDEIVEVIREQWPMCPTHQRMRIPDISDGNAVWGCWEDAVAVHGIPVGDLDRS